MDPEKAAEELKVIRQLMERPVRYSTQSGLSGVLAGTAALAGVAVDYAASSHLPPRQAFWINLVTWGTVFLVALAAVCVCTRLRERKQGMPLWSSLKARILRTIAPPFVLGMGLTLAIVFRRYFGHGPNQWGMVAAIWMAFYGLALWQMGEFSVPEVRQLGAAFMLAAVPAAAFFQPYPWPYLTLGVTFGGFHIVYGVVVWVRHGG
jgi:FtsH-binding integral membrane protein